jgi:hypothetical protein
MLNVLILPVTITVGGRGAGFLGNGSILTDECSLKRGVISAETET